MKKNLPIVVILMLAIIMLSFTSCIWKQTVNQAPSAVVNIYPAQSELVDENYFYSKWTQSKDPEGGAVTYRINYARTIEGLDDPTFYETVETYFLLPNLAEGIWYWRVTATDEKGNSTKSPIWTFTINGESLPQPVDPEEIPTDPSLIVSEVENTSFTLDWPAYEDRQNPGRAVEYVIYVYDQGQGMNTRKTEEMGYWMARIAPATTAHTTDTTYTFNNMQSQTLYDWVIVAQNNASQTSVVGSSQVRTGNRAPSQPELLNPTEGATDVATDVTLSWSASVDPDGDDVKYYVYIDMVKNTNRNVTVEGIEATEYQPEGLEEGRTYYWFIMAKDANGAATRTQTQTFMTKAEGMDVPHSPTPGDGTEGLDATAPPLLEWEHDKNGAPITYTVYMSANPKKIDKKAEGLTAKSYQIPGRLEGNTRYYWAIEAKDTGTDKTTRSGVWTFKTGTIEAPEQTGAITNSDGTQIELTYDKAMGDPSGKKDSYTVKKENNNRITSRETRTITTYQTIETSKIERKAGTTNAYVLTLEEAIESGDSVFIDYTPGTIQSTDGGKLAKYENKPVTNRVPGEAPLVTEATASTNTIEIAFDKDMKDVPSGAKTQFSVQSGSILKQIESVERTASDTYTLTLKDGQSIAYGETVLISYAKGSVQAQNEAYLESFAGIAANNTVPAPQPQFVSGETSEDGLTVKVTFDRAMADPTGKHGQFHLGINENDNTTNRSAPTTTIESATLNSADAKIIELGLNRAVSNEDVLTLDYTAGDVESADGAELATFTDKPISNRVPAPLPICTAATMTADGRHVEIGFSRDMKTPTAEEANQFGVLVNGYVDEIESATLSADKRVITLNLQKPIGKNNEVHLSYTKGTVAATNDGLLESFQNKKVNTDALDTIWVIKGIGWNYSRIQDAIDAPETEDGDIIMVATGTYVESVQFGTKKIILKSTYETDENAVNTTIIDGSNDGYAIMIGTTEYSINTREMNIQSVVEGFTLKKGGTDNIRTDSRSVMGGAAGIMLFEKAEIKHNIITQNGDQTSGKIGCGIYVGSVMADIHDNIIEDNYNIYQGAGILVGSVNDSSARGSTTGPQIYNNIIRNNQSEKGAGIYIYESATVYNAAGEPWKPFNVPNAELLFVEDTTAASANTYNGNNLIQTVMNRSTVQEGANIEWEVEEETPKGTLTLRPETEFEQHEITLNLDYTIGTEYHNGSVVFTIGENNGNQFEITEGASVVIGEEATAITNYTYSTSVATLTGIKLEEGTVTLRLTPQETPAGTVVNQIATRDLDYEMSAVGDADGNDSVWSETTASTATFVAKELSIVTDIEYKTGNEPYVKLLETPKRLKVASETTVDTVLAAIKATDDSSQTYVIITTEGTRTGTDELTGEATLIVTAEHGNTQAYAVTINPTAFVRLETSASDSEGRLISRTAPPSAATTWHDTISEAVTDAHSTVLSTITVWPGYYIESLNLGTKPIHLMSTDPASETVRNSTIIDGNENTTVVYIGQGAVSSQRSDEPTLYTIVEGFTIKNAMGSNFTSSERGGMPEPACGVCIDWMNAIIRNNLITENGTDVEHKSGRGLYVSTSNSDVKIHDNIISYNTYTYTFESMSRSVPQTRGAGIFVESGSPEIYDNVIDNNISDGNGGGICLGSEPIWSASRSGRDVETYTPIVYGNTISNNTAENGAGVYVYSNMNVKNGDETSPYWREFNVPNATVDFVEHNDTEDNNTYTSNQLTGGDAASSREVQSEEGRDICFEGPIESYVPQLLIAPATATGNAGEPITVTATVNITGYTYEGSMTFKLPEECTITTDASVTIGEGTKRSLKGAEVIDEQTVLLTGLTSETGDQSIILNFIHTGELAQAEYEFSATCDADGTGTLYSISEEATDSLEIPPQYAAPDVAVVSPVEGTEFATTTMTFTWEATAGAQSNTSAREVQGISGYVVAWANRAGEWASATIDNGATKEYATDTLAYGEDYSWHVKVIGANGKTVTTTPDATFITTYRLRDLGTEGVAYTLDNDTNFEQYTIGFDTDDLPARFNGMTNFHIVVKGNVYKFTQNEFDTTSYNVTIDYTAGTPDEPSEDDVRNGWFEEHYDYRVDRNGVSTGFDTFTEAFDSIQDSETVTLYVGKDEVIQNGSEFEVVNHQNITIRPEAYLSNIVFDGNDAHRLFYVHGSSGQPATLTLVDVVLQNGYESVGGAVKLYYGDLILERGEVKNNSSLSDGGAIYMNNSFYTKITNSTLTYNSAGPTNQGGAIYCWYSSAEIIDTFIASNTARDGAGITWNRQPMKVVRTEFAYNRATQNGGAVYCGYLTDLEINECTITFNEASYGGGLYCQGNSPYPTVELNDNVISNNTATLDGGGIYLGDIQCVLKTSEQAWTAKETTENNFSVTNQGIVHSPAVDTDSILVKDNTADGTGDQMYVN